MNDTQYIYSKATYRVRHEEKRQSLSVVVKERPYKTICSWYLGRIDTVSLGGIRQRS